MSTAGDPSFAKLLEDTRRCLSRGRGLRQKLDAGGRLHIDRPVPFLCVYRSPADSPDPGTRRLLEGEAAYVLADGSQPFFDRFQSLCRVILKEMSDAFGAVLLLELWARADAPARPHAAPQFKLLASNHNAPARVLEVLESELLGVRVSGRTGHVDLSYRADLMPPGGLAPILTQQEATALRCTHIGLELEPHYRDPSNGHVYHYKLNEYRRGLAHALKRGFYAFALEHTRHRPSHYHELGRHAMTPVVWEVDRRLAEIGERFDLVLHVTPVNVPSAWREYGSSGFSTMPELLYKPRPFDPP